ncbi:hypothetical protein HDU86_000235 [Geranomyces michiganensis]|nr:hypothetical protein HDU86_000235 [Geranomyces michiganensis]
MKATTALVLLAVASCSPAALLVAAQQPPTTPAPVAAPAAASTRAAPAPAPAAAAATPVPATPVAAPPAAANSCGTAGANTVVTTQAELQAAIPAACTAFLGSLRINGPGITSLAPLAAIQSTQLTLEIGNTAIQTLQGLGALATVGEYIQIHDCNALLNTDGLASLKRIEGGLQVYQNAKLQSLSGFLPVTAINPTKSPRYAFGITVSSNPALKTLDGLQNLQTVGTALNVTGNAVLQDISALSGKTWTTLQVAANPMLCDLSPLGAASNATASNASTAVQKGATCGQTSTGAAGTAGTAPGAAAGANGTSVATGATAGAATTTTTTTMALLAAAAGSLASIFML